MGTQVKVMYELTSNETGCDGTIPSIGNACGIHIHEGDSCDNAGGHFWKSSAVSADPWATVAYTPGSKGETGMVETGYTFDESKSKVLVVHDSAGARVTCMVLGSTPPPADEVSLDS